MASTVAMFTCIHVRLSGRGEMGWGGTALRTEISAGDLVSRMAATLGDWGRTVAPWARRF